MNNFSFDDPMNQFSFNQPMNNFTPARDKPINHKRVIIGMAACVLTILINFIPFAKLHSAISAMADLARYKDLPRYPSPFSVTLYLMTLRREDGPIFLIVFILVCVSMLLAALLFFTNHPKATLFSLIPGFFLEVTLGVGTISDVRNIYDASPFFQLLYVFIPLAAIVCAFAMKKIKPVPVAPPMQAQQDPFGFF